MLWCTATSRMYRLAGWVGLKLKLQKALALRANTCLNLNAVPGLIRLIGFTYVAQDNL